MVAPQDDAPVMNDASMQNAQPEPRPTAGGNLYVGPSLGSSLLRVLGAIVSAPQR
jgi:hypothetical protein